ncbi:MAG: hypothetical protein IIV56_03450, partial [Mailhella sp.]|nr:hypothetical protein [Mailhella sp.]
YGRHTGQAGPGASGPACRYDGSLNCSRETKAPSGVFFLSNILLKGQISKYVSWLIPEQKNFQHQDMFGKAADIFLKICEKVEKFL